MIIELPQLGWRDHQLQVESDTRESFESRLTISYAECHLLGQSEVVEEYESIICGLNVESEACVAA